MNKCSAVPAIRDRKPRDTENITISIDRFLCLYAIKQAAKDSRPERLSDKLQELGRIESRDFVNGVSQS